MSSFDGRRRRARRAAASTSRPGSSRRSCAGAQHTEPPTSPRASAASARSPTRSSACNAIEDACGVDDRRSRSATLRRLLYCGEWIHSHALHIYLLHAPDFLGLSRCRQPGPRPPRRRRAGSGAEEGRQRDPGTARRPGHPPGQPARRAASTGARPRPICGPLAEQLRRALDDALATVQWVAAFDFPDLELDHEFLALTDPDRYAIERGSVVRQ